jgi:anti-sigma B factor antagonist
MKHQYLAMTTIRARNRAGAVPSSARDARAASEEARYRRSRLARGTPRTMSATRGRARRPRGGLHTLVLLGALDSVSACTLEAAIERLCESGARGITLDLRKLNRIDSTGVAVIAFRSKLCKRRGHDFTLIPGPRRIQRAFELAGVVDSLPFA